MTDYVDDDFSDDDVETAQDPGDIKSLRRAANSKKKLEQELLAAKRELAFTRAGIDPDDPKMKYFVKGYEGDLSAEAVRQAAQEAGFLSPPSQAPDPSQQAATAAQDRVMSAAAGAVVEDSSEAAAYARMEAAMEEGGIDAMLSVAREYGIPIATEM